MERILRKKDEEKQNIENAKQERREIKFQNMEEKKETLSKKMKEKLNNNKIAKETETINVEPITRGRKRKSDVETKDTNSIIKKSKNN